MDSAPGVFDDDIAVDQCRSRARKVDAVLAVRHREALDRDLFPADINGVHRGGDTAGVLNGRFFLAVERDPDDFRRDADLLLTGSAHEHGVARLDAAQSARDGVARIAVDRQRCRSRCRRRKAKDRQQDCLAAGTSRNFIHGYSGVGAMLYYNSRITTLRHLMSPAPY